jgi:[ribosomal protein S5]-alanine N-acetyltransferase
MLTTERLLLGEYEESDWEAVREIDSNPEVQRFRGGELVSEERTRDYLRWTKTLAQDPARRHYPFAICRREEDRVIGSCWLNITSPELREAELAYQMNRRHWGQGYVTEAARAVLAFGFEELKLHRVWAKCLLENIGSFRVMEKLGMRREGHQRENQWLHGRWWDTLLYAILDHEWRTRAV